MKENVFEILKEKKRLSLQEIAKIIGGTKSDARDIAEELAEEKSTVISFDDGIQYVVPHEHRADKPQFIDLRSKADEPQFVQFIDLRSEKGKKIAEEGAEGIEIAPETDALIKY